MRVNVFTRHRSACPHKNKVGYNKCYCPKYGNWSVDGRVKKTTLKTNDYADALRKASDLEADVAAGWTGRTTVRDAVTAYINDKRSQHLTSSTLNKLKLLFEKQLLTFCEQAGLNHVDQILLSTVQQWRNTWSDAPLTALKKQERVRGFFKFCVDAGWLRTNPSKGLSRIKVTQTPTEYFTDAEFDSIVAAARRTRYGKKLTALVLLMRWSGLAIRDAVTLERSRLDSEGPDAE